MFDGKMHNENLYSSHIVIAVVIKNNKIIIMI